MSQYQRLSFFDVPQPRLEEHLIEEILVSLTYHYCSGTASAASFLYDLDQRQI